MAQSLQPVRGTHDLLPEQARLYQMIVAQARDVVARYGFSEIMTPIFEFSEVFHRTLGETSDVVSKETYTFEDRGGESITLRPEITASIARAFISNGLQEQLPCKFFYAGPAFRYERPQKGRQRQFHQIGVELLGVEQVQADIEVIAMAALLFETLGLSEVVTLELNSLGDSESRNDYRAALVEYFSKHQEHLSDESKLRLHKNPLRILDSKSEQDRALVAHAPSMHDYFNETSKCFFTSLTDGLDALGIAYKVNPALVRGLDYYNHTVFEFTTDKLGSQNAVLAGGRYDGLIELMGGKQTAGVGFASGVERLMALLEVVNPSFISAAASPIVIIPMGDEAERQALTIAQRLRSAGFVIEQSYSGNMKKRLQKANKMNASAVLILGEDELKQHSITLRNLTSGEQKSIAMDKIEQELTTL